MGKTLGITVSNPRTIKRLQKLAKQLDLSVPVLLAVMSLSYEKQLSKLEKAMVAKVSEKQ